MKHVGVREFRDHATKYFAGDEVIAIERHGELVGYYMPATHEQRKLPKMSKAEAVEELARTAQFLMERTGFTEDELARFFDLSQPIPEDLLAKLEEQSVAAQRATRS
jgi:uncharacterized protein YcaQ